MTDRPVIAVIHGVARRDRDAFAREVETLRESLGLDADVVSLYWGDLPHPAALVETVLPYTSWKSQVGSLDDPGDSVTLRDAVRARDLEGLIDSISADWRRRSQSSRRRLLSVVYQLVRSQYLRASAEFTGDLVFYHRHRQRLWGHVWEQLMRRAPGAGLAERPVTVIAHSLGSAIAFEMATSADPRLHIAHLFTCATQSPFFHVTGCSPVEIDPTEAGAPVVLPATIGGWTNFYVPLDPWAYLTAPVFTLHDGSLPTDIEVHTGSRADRIVNHTSSHYWQHPLVIDTIRTQLSA
jgi:hypothetical protein